MTILDDLKVAVEATKPIQWYATQDALPPGKCFMFKGEWMERLKEAAVNEAW